jgi:hypothetical protein
MALLVCKAFRGRRKASMARRKGASSLGTEIPSLCSPNPDSDHRKRNCRRCSSAQHLAPSRCQLTVPMNNFGSVD